MLSLNSVMYLSKAQTCWAYIYVSCYLIYLSPSPGCGWEVVCWTILCEVVSSLYGFYISYMVLGAWLGFLVPRHLHMSHVFPLGTRVITVGIRAEFYTRQ